MKNSLIIVIYIICCVLLYGQEDASYNAKELSSKDSRYSFLGGVYSVESILQFEDSIKYESKISDLSVEIKTRTAELNKLKHVEAEAIPKHFTVFGGKYTYPRLTEKQMQAKTLNNKITKMENTIRLLKNKRSHYLESYNKLKLKDAKYMYKKLFWGFIIWEVKKEHINN